MPKKIIRRMESSNEISFPSIPGCQLVDSPIILEALIKGFQYIRGWFGSSSEVMCEYCFRNLGTKIKAKLMESRVPLVGFFKEVNYSIGVVKLKDGNKELGGRGIHNQFDDKVPFIKQNHDNEDSSVKKRRETQEEQRPETGQPDVTMPHPSPLERKAILNEKKMDNNDLVETPMENKPPEKHVDTFAWVLVDMTGIPHFVTEHELKTDPRIELRAKEEEHSSGQKEGDTVTGDDPMDEGIAGSNEPLEEGSAPEALEMPGKEMENKATFPKDEAETWNLYTDGASNEHRSCARLILIYQEGVEYSYALHLNFDNSNNDAKYEALLAGLRIATEMKVENVHAFIDSKLVANQVDGSYEARGEKTKNTKRRYWKSPGALANFK
nr:reverse transcriptase domain-containing protein [Tanacetum cinerariifolium]